MQSFLRRSSARRLLTASLISLLCLIAAQLPMAVAADEPTDAKDALDLPLVWSAEGDGLCTPNLLWRTEPDRFAVYVPYIRLGPSRASDTPQICTFDLKTGRATQVAAPQYPPPLPGFTTFGIGVPPEEHNRYFADAYSYAPRAGGKRNLVAFDRDAGKERWRVPLPDATTTYAPAHFYTPSAFVQAGRVIADTMAFDAATGKRLWSVTTTVPTAPPIELMYPVACGKHQAYYFLRRKPADRASLAVVDLPTGEIVHEEPLKHFADVTPTFRIYITGAQLTADEGTIVIHGNGELITGDTVQGQATFFDDVYDTKTWALRSTFYNHPPVVSGNLLIEILPLTISTPTTGLGAIDPATGRVVWRQTDNVGELFSDQVVGEIGGNLVVLRHKQHDSNMYLYGARADDGAILWRARLPQIPAEAHPIFPFIHAYYYVVGPDRLVQIIQWKLDGSDTFRHRLRCYKLLPPSQAAPNVSTAAPALPSLPSP